AALDRDSDLSMDSEEEFADESTSDKRRRLAKQYLDNLKEEVDDYAFDAADLDRDRLAERLKEDVAEDKGRIYRFLGDDLDFPNRSDPETDSSKIIERLFKIGVNGVTSIAVKDNFAYTISKDLFLTKWDISSSLLASTPRRVRYAKGDRHATQDPSYKGHTDEILCLAVSPDGKHVITGGRDLKVVIWAAESLTPLKAIPTKDRNGIVMGLAFRRNSSMFYAACADLKVRTYSLDQQAHIETLFGHQDTVVDIAALGQERCVTVGSRDRTAILWKIAEETRLTFRGGDLITPTAKSISTKTKYPEGSIDVCSMLDDQLFVTGSDNGNISLWSLQKKKPLFIARETHGIDTPMDAARATAESSPREIDVPKPMPRWVTAIHAIPYSDIFFTGSWDGTIKCWKLENENRKFSLIGELKGVKGVVNRIDIVETGGPKNKENINVYAAVSKEHRLGRWMKVPGGKNGIYLGVVRRK
ncbi:WD40 repeat-like protein, partial [Nadsonia fulvescens var. elongata DSM 6958]